MLQWIVIVLGALGGGGLLGWWLLFKGRTRVKVTAEFHDERAAAGIHIVGDPYPNHLDLFVVVRVILVSGGPVVLTASRAVVENNEEIDLQLIEEPTALEPKMPLDFKTGDLGFLTMEWGIKRLYVQGSLPKEQWQISRRNLRWLQREFPRRLTAIEENNAADEQRMQEEHRRQLIEGDDAWTGI